MNRGDNDAAKPTAHPGVQVESKSKSDIGHYEGAVVAILATHGFEQSELLGPKQALEEAGVCVDVVSPVRGQIRAWHIHDWGATVNVDVEIGEANPDVYDALVLPGGVMNPDTLRNDDRSVDFVRAFAEQHKPIAAICHGPWMLVEAGLVRGRKLTSWPSLKTDISNAGGKWIDKNVVVDDRLLTSRMPDDIPDFNRALLSLLVQTTETTA
jgi:protease I